MMETVLRVAFMEGYGAYVWGAYGGALSILGILGFGLRCALKNIQASGQPSDQGWKR